MPQDCIKPILLESVDSSTIDAVTYTAIDGGGIEHACSIIRITNASNQAVLISYDGAHDHEILLTSEHMDINLQINNRTSNKIALIPQGTIVYVRGTPGVGFIYLSGWYQ